MRQTEEKLNEVAKHYLEAIGGKDNLQELEVCSTRIRVVIKDKLNLNLNRIKEIGAKGIIERTEKEIHIIVGLESEEIVEAIERLV